MSKDEPSLVTNRNLHSCSGPIGQMHCPVGSSASRCSQSDAAFRPGRRRPLGSDRIRVGVRDLSKRMDVLIVVLDLWSERTERDIPFSVVASIGLNP